MKASASVALLGSLILAAGVCLAEEPIRLLGAIEGQVRNPSGMAQMGANVVLMNRYEKLIGQTLTNADGHFRFDSLFPDYYSIRVNGATYVPATKSNILVRAGMESFLDIQLANLISSIELVYTAPGQSGLVSDDWKWTLRSSSATRPVLRIQPQVNSLPPPTANRSAAFSSTRGVLKVSMGDQGASSALGSSPDMGTAFALATSVYGKNEVTVSGNVGYTSAFGAPTAGFRTAYRRSSGPTPDVELTVRQLAIRHNTAFGLLGGPANDGDLPALRTMTARLQERTQLTDYLALDYGVALESVMFMQRLNYWSPFARLSYDMGGKGVLQLGYSSGVPPADLNAPVGGGNPEYMMQRDLSGLAMFPRVSMRAGNTRVQRSDNYEIGYTKVLGKQSFSAAAYEQTIHDWAVPVTSPSGFIPSSELLPDLASTSSIFNIGNFNTRGFMLGAQRSISDHWTAGLAYGMGGTLTPTGVQPGDVDELRKSLQAVNRQWAAARLGGTLPYTGSRIVAAYVWTPGGGLTPAHVYLTQGMIQPAIGLNLSLRQPLPYLGGSLGRIEATAEIRNLLSQGYVPVTVAGGGDRLYFVQFPKTLSGGLSFIF
jgi:hypothetical protein